MNLYIRVLVVVVSACLLSPNLSEAAVEEMVESFDGDGAFASMNGEVQGFDNPGWFVGSDDRLERGGFLFKNNASHGEEEADRLARYVEGAGGFISQVRLRELDLGELHEESELASGAGLRLYHFLADEPGGHDVFWIDLAEFRNGSPNEPDHEWMIGVGSGDDGSIGMTVPRGSNVLLEIRYDAELSETTFLYDNDFEDDTSPIEFGPFPYLGPTSSGRHVTEFQVFSASDGMTSGLLDHMSITPYSSVVGDFDRDSLLGVGDLNQLQRAIRAGEHEIRFDLTGDALVDAEDRDVWVHDLKKTYLGDANLDGEFASSDLVNLFTAGEYEDGVLLNSTWTTGDWNGDGEFTTSDLVLAFQDGGYEQGPRAAPSVPEPTAPVGVVLGLLWLASSRRKPRLTDSWLRYKENSLMNAVGWLSCWLSPANCIGNAWNVYTSVFPDSFDTDNNRDAQAPDIGAQEY